MSLHVEDRVQKKVQTCIHYNGIMHDVCEAGVDYEEKAGGRPALRKLPCMLHRSENTVACEHATYMSYEEAKADVEGSDRHVRDYLDQIAKGNCPHCYSVMWSQAGRCVYCDGCGARLYQGTLPDDKRPADYPSAAAEELDLF